MNPKLEPTGPNLSAKEAGEDILQAVREERGDIEQERILLEQQTERQKLIDSRQEFLDKFDDQKAKDKHAELDPKDWGSDQVWQEIHNAFQSGLGTGEEALVTFPERTLDMVRGEDVGAEDYEPEWNPYKNVEHPITKTWWGKIIEGFAHYGSMATVAAPIAAKLGIPAAGGIGTTAITAALTDRTDGDSVSGEVVKRAPWTSAFLGPFATKETDHPVVKKFRNILEEVYAEKAIEGLFGLIARRIFGSATPGIEQAAIRKTNVDSQILEKGQLEFEQDQEFKRRWTEFVLPGQRGLPGDAVDLGVENVDVNVIEPNQLPKGTKGGDLTTTTPTDTPDLPTTPPSVFRGHKNKPIADIQQGSPNSTGKPLDIHNDLNRIDAEWDAHDHGSTDSPMTAAQAERMATESGLTIEFLQEKAKELMGDARFQQMLHDVEKNKSTFRDTFEPAYKRYQEIMGRDIASMDTDEFWSIIENQKKFQTGDGTTTENFEAWSMEHVIVADLVNSALFKQLRDLSLGAREISDFADIFAVDGPMKTIADRLVVGLTNVKRSRYLISTEFSKLKGDAAKRAVKDFTQDIHQETQDGVKLMMQMMRDSDSIELANGILEVWSQADKIQNWMDFDNFMRKRVYGGKFKGGDKKTGQIIRELQGVMINSRLSGFRTPQRAIIGTGFNEFLTEWNTLVGATIRAPFTGDTVTLKANLAKMKGMFEVIPEAWDTFNSKLNSYFSSDITQIKSRYGVTRHADFNWDIQEAWLEKRGNDWDKYLHRIGRIGYNLNNDVVASWSPRTLKAGDDAHAVIMGRARAKEKAMIAAIEAQSRGDIPEVNEQVLKQAEDLFFNQLLDEHGDIDVTKDAFLEFEFREGTLTTELGENSALMERLFNQIPLLKPHFMFIRPSINGLKVNVKNMPLLNLVLDEARSVHFGKPDNFEHLAQYGITNAQELANAKSKWLGRLAMGMGITYMGVQKYLTGGLTGNGPVDPSIRKMWEDGGWERGTISLFGQRFDLDTIEPYSILMKSIADVGDNMYLMGPEWAEERFQAIALSVAAASTSKTFMQGANNLVELFKGTPGSKGRIIGGLLNDQVPMGGARNDIGKLLNPYMRELSKSTWDAIRNRNLITEHIARDPLPVSYNILNGKPRGGANPLRRMFNAAYAFRILEGNSEALWLLKNSNFDERLSTYTSPDGIKLQDENGVRSKFQKAIGDWRNSRGQSLEDALVELSKEKRIIESINEMRKDMKNGNYDIDPMKAYYHNDRIKALFKLWRKKGWASIRFDPDVQRLYWEAKNKKSIEAQKRRKTGYTDDLLLPTR
tara:strand:- start:2654 stop:6577 length:3924 start_codon:yes stop_codon:yes gene_type:complete